MSAENSKPLEPKAFTMFKNVYSVVLLIFSIVLIMGLIFTRQTGLSQDAHPAAAFIVLWCALIWLSMVEGGQASIVGLQPVNKELYRESHPKSIKTTEITTKGDNLDRYLMGRQFMVIFIVFCINLSGAPVSGATLWGMPQWITEIFLVTGIAMILLTCMVGQLASQVNASHCMLDYINNYFALFTLYVAMAVEVSGFMHVSYLIAIIVAKCAGKPIESNEPPRAGFTFFFFWARVLFSMLVLGFSLAVTLSALFQGKTTMWQGVPEWVSVILFFVLMGVVGMLEGMQIAFFAVAKIPEKERGEAKFAMKTCHLLYKNKAHNLAAFMIGRQLSVVTCFFVVARVTTVTGDIWGLPQGFQNLFATGFLGAVITTILASISWQLVASVFPLAFLSNPLTYVFLRICLAFEWTGICNGAWVLAALQKKIMGFQRDEVYIGTAEERAAKALEDHQEDLHLGAGHMVKLPMFVDTAPDALKDLIRADPSVLEWMKESIKDGSLKIDEEVLDQAAAEVAAETEEKV
jgi:silicon transporter